MKIIWKQGTHRRNETFSEKQPDPQPLLGRSRFPRRHFCFFSPLSYSFFIFCWLVSLLLCLLCLFVLYVILALWPPVLQFQLPTLLFVYVLFDLYLLFIVVCLVNQSRSKGEGCSTTNLLKPPPPIFSLLSLFCFGLYGKFLFIWLSLVVSMMVSFRAVLFPMRFLG